MKENNINLDAHSSLIIADGSVVEINGQKVLLTLVKDATEHKVIDLHKDSWGVYNDGSQRFKDTVIKWLNNVLSRGLDGNVEGGYYGLDKHMASGIWENKNMFTHILTLDEFCDLAKKVPCSDVTDTPPLPSLKYEDCFERVNPKLYVNYQCKVSDWDEAREDCVATERQAKQLAATIKLMTIAYDANGGEWIPKNGEQMWSHYIERADNVIGITDYIYTTSNPIYFRDRETAQRAYEANKEIFHDYFGVNN